jgi:hypothetical protein
LSRTNTAIFDSIDNIVTVRATLKITQLHCSSDSKLDNRISAGLQADLDFVHQVLVNLRIVNDRYVLQSALIGHPILL